MSSINENSRSAEPATRSRPLKSFLIGIGILAVGIAVAVMVIKSAPRPQKVKPEIKARLVEVADIQAQDSRPMWLAGGQVMAAQQVLLKPQVSGRVIEIAPRAVPGERLNKGDLLARIDPQDYKLTLQQREAAVIQAQADLDIELGQASLAREEYELSQASLSVSDKALVLRKPQIAKAKAALKTANANLKRAQLDLQRASIRMPFNGQINRRSVSVGSQVSSTTDAFDLVNVEQFWIEVKIPAMFLPWLDQNHPVTVRQSGWQGKTRLASIVNVLPAVDSADRQIKLILSINDPLALKNTDLPKILLNDFVEVELAGKVLAGTYQIESRFLNDNDEIWVVNNDQLEKRQLQVVYHGREFSWVKASAEHNGVQAGDQLLLSRIDAAVPGLPVRLLIEQAQ